MYVLTIYIIIYIRSFLVGVRSFVCVHTYCLHNPIAWSNDAVLSRPPYLSRPGVSAHPHVV